MIDATIFSDSHMFLTFDNTRIRLVRKLLLIIIHKTSSGTAYYPNMQRGKGC